MSKLNFDFSILKVEKDVPMPSKARKSSKKNNIADVLVKMKKGDSFLMPNKVATNTIKYLSSAANSFVKNKKKNWKFVTRSEKDGVRIWRTK